MIVVGTHTEQQKRRRHDVLANGTGYYKGEYMLVPPGTGPSPQAFLVEQEANATILTHYHQQNQFQVVVGGDGTLGRHAVAPLLVHYAGAFTGYGPIVSGAQGLQYLTFRANNDPGAQFLPEARERLVRGPKAHFSSEPISTLDSAARRTLPQVQCEDILPLADDGLAVLLYRLPPGAAEKALAPSTGHGQYLVVVAGSMRVDGRVLESPENVFLSQEESAFTMNAGPEGLEVLLLQFPPLAPEYRSPETAPALQS
jgi:hypothetical protein